VVCWMLGLGFLGLVGFVGVCWGVGWFWLVVVGVFFCCLGWGGLGGLVGCGGVV